MPIYEFICQNCEKQFEVIVQGSEKVKCPACASRKIARQLSVFAAQTKNNSFGRDVPAGSCGSCGDPRGPGSCSLN